MITKEVVYEHLKVLGIPASIKGFNYLMESIMLVAENPDYIGSVTKSLYPEVARKCKSTPSRVERAMRHAIDIIFYNTSPGVLFKYFGNTISYARGKLTNSQFIAGVVAYITYGGQENAEH